MKDSLILEGKIYISARRAARVINYAQDYIGQLCRADKLDCKMVGRSWFVTEESLLAHRENALDSTEERVLKIIKGNDIKTRETIKTTLESEKKNEQGVVAMASESPTIPSPIVSPLVAPATGKALLKYEPEKKSLLPELNKKVPSTFTLPKNISNLAHTPFLAPKVVASATSAPVISPVNPLATTLVAILLLVSGFLFVTSFAKYEGGKHLAYREASVVSAISGFFTRIMQALGFASRTTSPLASEAPFSDNPSPAIKDLNGMGVVPSTNSANGDAVAKTRIISSFSDEVTVHADKSGTAGVITPVFRKTNGDDFLYVLVPVKEKKQ